MGKNLFKRPMNRDVLLDEAKIFFAQEFQISELSETEKKKMRKLASVVLWELDSGRVRVSHKENDQWVTQAWVKRAILGFFSLTKSYAQSAGVFQYLDKLPVKSRAALKGVRVVPGAIARYGSFVED